MQDYIPQKIDINGQIDEIVVKQFDNLSRFIHIQITDSDNPESAIFNLTGCTARLFVCIGEIPVYIDGEIADEENGVISFNLPSGLTQTVGKFPCEIRISNAQEQSVISTRQFTLTVLDSLFDSDALEATPQFSALENALFQIAVDRARLTRLEAMAVDGDALPGTAEAELLDIRTGYDGTEYASAGAAVRGQIADIYADRRAATAAEFAAAMGEDIPDEAREIANDLQNLLDGANGFDGRITALETGLSMTQQNIPRFIPNNGITRKMLAADARPNRTAPLALECLGDSFVDYRTPGNCWSCQGFAADDSYFYIYRVGKLWYDENDVLLTDKACGYLQKIDRDTLETVATHAFYPNVGDAVIPYGLEHCNDMTVVTIDDATYLLAVAGNDLANAHQHFGAWLISTEDLSVVSGFTLTVQENDEEHAVYRVAAIKGTDEIYLVCGQIIYKGTVSLNGVTVTDTLEVTCNVNQGIDYDGGFLYGLDASARAMEIINLNENRNYYVKFDYLMQGYILAEAESVAAFGDDVYIAGGTNANGAVGMSQTLICHGNLRSQVKQFSRKANIRNLDQPIALYVGQPEPLIKIVNNINDVPESGTRFIDYYLATTQNGSTSYRHFHWNAVEGENGEITYQREEVEHEEPLTSISESGNISDDGSYDFAYHTGYASMPFNSVYTAWLAAKSLFLLGLGVRFNIHVNVPIVKNIYIYDAGFTTTLTSDIQEDYPASAQSKLVLHDVRGVVNLDTPLLEVIGGQINLTGAVTNIHASDGAVIFYNSPRELATADGDSNFLIVARNKMFTRFGTLEFTPYENSDEEE